jgi:protein gp37
MSANSPIEWTDATWNPVRGCTMVSPGCTHCYAATFAERFRGVPGHPYEQGFDLRLVPEKLTEPLQWAAPKRVFVNSMSDLFHVGVPDLFIAGVTSVMLAANWHTFQVLTKRADRMAELLRGPLRSAAELPNVWWGVSVEDRKYGLPRIDRLRDTPAAVRFLSIEPLLEDLGEIDLSGIHWVIVGGESGPGARPMDAGWVRSIRDQCAAAGVKFWFRQWGGVNKKTAGRELDGRTHDDMPTTSPNPVPPLAQRRTLLRAYEELWPVAGFKGLSTHRPGTVAAARSGRPSRRPLETVGSAAARACTAGSGSNAP